MTKLRVFGCDAWVLRPPEHRENKLEPVSIKGKFVGMARNGEGYVVYAAGRHYESAHVRFDEDSVLHSKMGASGSFENEPAQGEIAEPIGAMRMDSNGGAAAHLEPPRRAADGDDDGAAAGATEGGATLGADDGAARSSRMLAELAPDDGATPRLDGRSGNVGVAEMPETVVPVGSGRRPDGGAFNM